MVERRYSNNEDNGKSQVRRGQDRKSLEADSRRDHRNGRKAWGVALYARLSNRPGQRWYIRAASLFRNWWPAHGTMCWPVTRQKLRFAAFEIVDTHPRTPCLKNTQEVRGWFLIFHRCRRTCRGLEGPRRVRSRRITPHAKPTCHSSGVCTLPTTKERNPYRCGIAETLAGGSAGESGTNRSAYDKITGAAGRSGHTNGYILMTNGEVRSANSHHQASAISTIVLGFAADPMTRWVWPDASEYLKMMPRFVRAFGGPAFEHGTAYITGGFAPPPCGFHRA